MKKCECIIYDERSMKGQAGLSVTSERIAKARDYTGDDHLGGIPMYIQVGDDGQIGPIHDTRLWSPIQLTDKNACKKALGKSIYHTFTDVVFLRENPRCDGNDRWNDLLLRLRNLEHTEDDFNLLFQTKYAFFLERP